MGGAYSRYVESCENSDPNLLESSQLSITHLKTSGNLSRLCPSRFLREFFVETATVQHKINSVDNSTGCRCVVSSGTCQ